MARLPLAPALGGWPGSQEGYLLAPCPTLQTPFPPESFFSKPETIIQTSESEISSSESDYRKLFQIEKLPENQNGVHTSQIKVPVSDFSTYGTNLSI
ncbi:hypothetical protein ACFO1V_10430 [Daeguia caeni]|uniref:Uncharacterized protein n=1 Tax=Daeguia caeni TaxID=439612 RepID=A0ABV9H7S0_9HYPH